MQEEDDVAYATITQMSEPELEEARLHAVEQLDDPEVIATIPMEPELDQAALALEVLPMRKTVSTAVAAADDVYNSLKLEGLNEPERAKRAFRAYVALGKGRTLANLATQYSKREEPTWTNNYDSVLRQLKDYSRKYKWQERIRMVIVRASAEVLAEAQRDAFVHAKVRIDLAREMQDAGKTIIDKADLNSLSVEEARELFKDGLKALQIGLTSERAEQGDVLASIRPEKPIEQMTKEELDEYAQTLQKAIK
jgi:hypothetical protein